MGFNNQRYLYFVIWANVFGLVLLVKDWFPTVRTKLAVLFSCCSKSPQMALTRLWWRTPCMVKLNTRPTSLDVYKEAIFKVYYQNNRNFSLTAIRLSGTFCTCIFMFEFFFQSFAGLLLLKLKNSQWKSLHEAATYLNHANSSTHSIKTSHPSPQKNYTISNESIDSIPFLDLNLIVNS